METRFVKVGNDYVNVENLENFHAVDDKLSVSTISKNSFTFEHGTEVNEAAAMKKLIRRINEKAHEITYIDAYAKHDDAVPEEDEASNLLYRKWLERMNGPADAPLHSERAPKK